MEMTSEMRSFVLSLNASTLTDSDVSTVYALLLGPKPYEFDKNRSPAAQKVAAQVYVRLMQGEPAQSATGYVGTWRQGHAR